MKIKSFLLTTCCLIFSCMFVQVANSTNPETPVAGIDETQGNYYHKADLAFRGASSATLTLTFPGSGFTANAVYFKNQQITNFYTVNGGIAFTVNRSTVASEISSGNPTTAIVYANGGNDVITYTVYCFDYTNPGID